MELTKEPTFMETINALCGIIMILAGLGLFGFGIASFNYKFIVIGLLLIIVVSIGHKPLS